MSNASLLSAPTRVRYLVVASLSAATVIAYVLRSCMNTLNKPISAELSLSNQEIGIVMGSFFLGYAIFQVPAGLLRDRWGTGRSLAFFAVTWSLAGSLMALANDFYLLLVCWFSCGAAQAGIFPAAINAVKHWLPHSRIALASGALTSFQSVGVILASSLTTPLLGVVDWPWVFLIYALPGLIWAAWFQRWFREWPDEHTGVNAAELAIIRPTPVAETSAQRNDRSHVPWLAILTTPALWAICGQQFCRASAFIFYSTWFPRFLEESRSIEPLYAGLMTSLPVMAFVVFATPGGAISDWLVSRTGSRRIGRQVYAATCLAVCSLLILVARSFDDALAAVLVIAAGSVCAALAGPVSYTITIEMGGKHLTTIFALMNMSGNIGAFVFPIILPWLVKQSGDWNVAFYLCSGIYLASALCWLAFDANEVIGTVKDEG
jgi:ACS family glucarate transporter-like MFS transporter